MINPPRRAFPKCPGCKGETFVYQSTTFKKVAALVIYCDACGVVVGVINDTSKDKKK